MTTKLTLFLKFKIIKRYYPGPGTDLALNALAITLPNLQKALIPSNRMLQDYYNSNNSSEQNFINFALTIKKESFIHEKDYYDLRREFYLNFRSVKEFYSVVWRKTLIYPKLIEKPSWMDDSDYKSLENERERLIRKYLINTDKHPVILSIPLVERKTDYSLQEEEKIITFLSSALTNKSIIDNDSLKYCHNQIKLKTTIMKNNDKLKKDSSLLYTKKNDLLLTLYKQYIKANLPDLKEILKNHENRDRIEYKNFYAGKSEPITESGIAIKALLDIETFLFLIVLDDYKQDVYRLEKTKYILTNYKNDLKLKELLEILRRCGLIVNNDAGYKNHVSYLEGQGPKVDQAAYQILESLSNNQTNPEVNLSLEENKYISHAINNKEYKIMVTVDNPNNAVVLDGLRLHMNLVIDHPINKDKCFVIGFLTSSNDDKTVPFSNQQEFFDINRTTDKSKLPQFAFIPNNEIYGQRENDKKNNEENKGQYFRFNKKIILADKQYFLENSLATNHLHNGVNENGQAIADLLVSSFQNLFDIMKTHSVQEPITFTSELLIQIALKHIENTLISHYRYIDAEQIKIESFSSSRRKEYLDRYNKKKQEYFENYQEIIYQRIVTALYPNYIYFLKIKNELEIQKKLQEKSTQKQKKREANIEAKAAHELRQKQKPNINFEEPTNNTKNEMV